MSQSPLGWKIITLLLKPRDNQNFLPLGVLCSIEKSFKFCQSLPVAIDDSAELSQLTTIAAVELHSGICVSDVEGLAGKKKLTISLFSVNSTTDDCLLKTC